MCVELSTAGAANDMHAVRWTLTPSAGYRQVTVDRQAAAVDAFARHPIFALSCAPVCRNVRNRRIRVGALIPVSAAAVWRGVVGIAAARHGPSASVRRHGHGHTATELSYLCMRMPAEAAVATRVAQALQASRRGRHAARALGAGAGRLLPQDAQHGQRQHQLCQGEVQQDNHPPRLHLAAVGAGAVVGNDDAAMMDTRIRNQVETRAA